jgi:hypothetical protein
MNGKLYINKKLQKKIVAHKRIREAGQAHFRSTQNKPQREWRPKARKPKYKVLKKVMEASDISSFIHNTTSELMGLKISEPLAVSPDDDWPISRTCDLPRVSLTHNVTKVSDSSSSYNLSQISSCPDQPKKKFA